MPTMEYRQYCTFFLLFCVTVSRCVHAQETSKEPKDETSEADDNPVDKATIPSKGPTSAPPSGSDEPGFVLRDDSNTICFRAVLESKIVVRYRTKNLDNTKVLETNLSAPNTSAISGSCNSESERVVFNMAWADGNYTLTLQFKQTVQVSRLNPNKRISTWSASKIKFVFDATNNPEFPGIIKRKIFKAISDSKEVHFEAPSNLSYSCSTQEDIPLSVQKNGTVDTSVIDSVMLSVWDVKIQAFEVPQSGSFSESASCTPDLEKNPSQNVAPLVVAACLAVLIAIIIVAYYFIKNKQNTQYSSME